MSLEAQFAFLDDLPEALYRRVVTLHHGGLRQRVAGILAWRQALLRGELPDRRGLAWPDPAIAETLLLRLDALDLVSFCRRQEALVDQILKDVCDGVESILRRRAQGIHGLFDDIVEGQQRHERETSRLSAAEDVEGVDHSGENAGMGEAGDGGPGEAGRGRDGVGDVAAVAASAPPIKPGGGGNREAGGQAAAVVEGQGGTTAAVGDDPSLAAAAGEDGAGTMASAAAALTQAAAEEGATADLAAGIPGAIPPTATELQALGEALERRWARLLAHWREAEAVFRGMGSRLGRGWDLASSELHGSGWQAFVAYRRLIRNHPQLVAIVDALGREESATGEGATAPLAETLEAPGEADATAPRFIHSESPQAARGITRSDDIARMLPQEAAYLGHPQLKLLWHARRAEQALLSYQVEGVLSEHRPEPLQHAGEEPRPRPAGEHRRGPLILCLDTSASLHGEPERIAKAVCLEVLRLANQSRRRCLLYAFSGPGQVVEQELRLDPGGLREILRFLARSFHGGTDIRTPIERALARVREAHWRRADMLLISDGRFPVPLAVAAAVQHARAAEELRLTGLVIGRWRSAGLSRLCRPVHRFQPPSALEACD